MMELEILKEKGKEIGFTHVNELESSTIQLMTEVRDMCAANTCGQYGVKWSCPPGCGTLEECEARVRSYDKGLIVQTVGQLEDNMDIETMMETESIHKENFIRFRDYLLEKYPKLLPLGAGCCTNCSKCTYPHEPCRFPDKAIASMEAYGMLVNQVCKDNGVAYNYGPCTISYTSCYLLF